MSTAFFHPELVGKTVEEIASSLAAPGTAPYVEYVERLPRTLSEAYRRMIDRFFDAYVEKCRRYGGPVSRVRCENAALVMLAREQFHWKAIITGYDITEEHVKGVVTHYTPHWLIQNENPSWPTSWWFRFAQTNWGKSRWHMVPDFPPAMLALGAFDLVSTSRWMGDDVLTDAERLEFVLLQRKCEFDGSDSLKSDQIARHSELMSWMPYGGELPILDIDAGDVADRPEGKDLTPEQMKKVHREYAEIGAKYALAVTEVWRKITGVTPRWTVTNDRGGLHGLNQPLPPHVRHPYLLRSLMQEMKKLLPAYGVAHKVKGESKASSAPVALDLTAYNKYPGGRGGMWRVPLCMKNKPGSLPQVPVADHLDKMPWLSILTPVALGSDWQRFEPAQCSVMVASSEAYGTKIEEQSVRRGEAYRDPSTNRVRHVRREAARADLDLGTAEFTETALRIREILPERGGGGPSRHEVRLALAGWLLGEGLPVEAALATLRASGGNPEDAHEAVISTAARRDSGRPVAGGKALADLVGEDAFEMLRAALTTDRWDRLGKAEEAEPVREEVKGQELTPEEAAPPEEEETKDAAGHDHEEQPVATDPKKAWEATGNPPPDAVKAQEPEGAEKPKPKVKPKDQEGQGQHVARSLTNPLNPHHLELLEAKKRASEGRFRWDTNAKGGALYHTGIALANIKAVLHHQKLWWVGNVVGGVFLFAGIGRQTVKATCYGNVKVESVLSGYLEMEKKIKNWEPGKILPEIPSLFAIRKSVGHLLYNRLLDAIQLDLRLGGAPFDVQWRALIDQSRSSEERDVLHWLLINLVKSGTAASDPRFATGEWERLDRVFRCARLANEKTCTDHGTVATIPLNCDVEVGCRCCRSKLHGTIADWIKAKWYHENYVVLEWKASTEPVLIDVHDDPNSAVYDPSREYDEEAMIFAYPRSKENEKAGVNKRFVLNHVNTKGERVPWVLKPRRKGRSKKGKRLGKVLSMNLLDRIKKGFSQTDDLRVLKLTTGNNLAYRGFMAPDGVFLVMPESFLEKRENGMPEERNTLEHLKLVGVFKNCKMRLVTKDEMLSEVLHARMKIGEDFDRLLHQFMLEASEAPKTAPELDENGKPKKRELSETEVAVLTYPFLKKRSMAPVQNDAAEVDLEWYTAESLREFKAELRAEKYGPDEVKPNECPVPVLQPDGTTKPCRKIFSNALVDQRSRRILAQNSTGKHYPQKEAWAIADQQAHGWGVQYGTNLGPAHEACAHGGSRPRDLLTQAGDLGGEKRGFSQVTAPRR